MEKIKILFGICILDIDYKKAIELGIFPNKSKKEINLMLEKEIISCYNSQEISINETKENNLCFGYELCSTRENIGSLDMISIFDKINDNAVKWRKKLSNIFKKNNFEKDPEIFMVKCQEK